jgi:hypothetical protein
LWSDLEAICGVFGQLAKKHLSEASESERRENRAVALKSLGDCARAISKSIHPVEIELLDEAAKRSFELACGHAMPLVEGGGATRVAALCALRDYAKELAPAAAEALLASAPVEFSARGSARRIMAECEPLQPERPRSPGMPSLGMSQAERREMELAPYQLVKNGSFRSEVAEVFGSAEAVVAASPGMSRRLGMEHMVYRHILSTPDGDVHGLDNIGEWARSVRAIGEALRLAGESKPGKPGAKSLSI